MDDHVSLPASLQGGEVSLDNLSYFSVVYVLKTRDPAGKISLNVFDLLDTLHFERMLK